MKAKKVTYNKLLLQYKKYVSKLERFEREDKNQHRQKVLKNHISRVLIKLRNLFKSIQKISAKETAFASVFLCGMTFTTGLTAQTFTRLADTTPFNLTDIGSGNSSPAFADLDGDGDLDLMSGEYYNGDFYYFQNTGSSSAPAFATGVRNPFGLGDINNYNSSPAFADLDSDGDLDLMSGEYYGAFRYFQNTGGSSTPAFATKEFNPFGLTDVGDNSTPTLADLDSDGDLDLMSGIENGKFVYFQNTGSSSAPAFATKVDNPFGLGDAGSYSDPTLADLDGDGDLDLMSGAHAGTFHYFQNTGTSSAPAFATKDDNPFGLAGIGARSTPILADLDGNGDLDLMSGRNAGTFVYFVNTSSSLSVEENTAGLSGLSYNSTNGTLNNPNGILLKNGSIFDITGRELYRFDLESRSKEQGIPAFSNLLQGVYILKINSDLGILALKILVD